MRKDADATAVLGDFNLEPGNLPHKCLLFCWHGMISNLNATTVKEKKAMSTKVYNAIRPISGKGGYEMRRFSGAAGLTSDVTDKNMLRAVAVNEGALPRKSWACIFIRDVDRYYVVYRRSNPAPTESVITHVEYSPPRDGG